ncbi:MAG: endonuclease III, partial [Pirellulales bacterium]
MAARSDAQKHAARIVKELRAEYPQAECALTYNSPLELLVATILSAQCTDVRVNMVTPELFRQHPTAADYASARREDIERIIQSTGFFRAKAKNIQGCCQRLVDAFDGQVPPRLEDLVT